MVARSRASDDAGKPQKIKVGACDDVAGLKSGDEVQARVTDTLAIVEEKPAKE
jgi:hypothetical protein